MKKRQMQDIQVGEWVLCTDHYGIPAWRRVVESKMTEKFTILPDGTIQYLWGITFQDTEPVESHPLPTFSWRTTLDHPDKEMEIRN